MLEIFRYQYLAAPIRDYSSSRSFYSSFNTSPNTFRSILIIVRVTEKSFQFNSTSFSSGFLIRKCNTNMLIYFYKNPMNCFLYQQSINEPFNTSEHFVQTCNQFQINIYRKNITLSNLSNYWRIPQIFQLVSCKTIYLLMNF